jgi:queuine tRNA-ribosyltransferase
MYNGQHQGELPLNYEIARSVNGQESVKDHKVGECMHSSMGAWQEANTIYIEQSDLRNLLAKPSTLDLVIYDVGMGIAANALATLDAFERLPSERKLHLVSFESQIGGIEFALHHLKSFPFLKKNKDLIRQLLRQKTVTVSSPGGRYFSWDLLEGDFRETIALAPAPEIIYYDFYSPKACPEVWTVRCFDLLFRATAPRRQKGLNTSLYTYCSSTAARTGLLASGFFVGRGTSTPTKKETTIATTMRESLQNAFGKDWLTHLQRSGKPWPPDLTLDRRNEVRDFLSSEEFWPPTGQAQV